MLTSLSRQRHRTIRLLVGAATTGALLTSGLIAAPLAQAAPAPNARSSIMPAAVPSPTTNQSVITVKVGGTRTSVTSVSGLPGVTLKLYDGTASGPGATPRPESWATCVSDADGDCSFIVPETQSGGANRDSRFWIKQTGSLPAGWIANPTLAVGNPAVSTPYEFRTGSRLRGGQTYTSTQDFMIGSGTGSTVSGGIWQVARTNPPPPPQCGIKVALVMDLSGSVTPFIDDLRNAASSFVDSLTGTPSSMSLFTFSSVAPAPTGANLGLTPVSTAAGAQVVKDRIATYTTGNTTNWDRGLYQVASSPTIFDLAVVITDGNPTVYGNNEGPGSTTRFREVENGVFSSNAIAAQGTRVVAVGVGDGIDGAADNLSAISGPVEGSDYYQTADYAAAAASMRALALGACKGSVSVVKQVVPNTTTGETITGAQPASGWGFTAASLTAGVTPASQSGTTATGTGAVNFPLDYAGGTTTGTLRVAETAQAGYSLVTQGGKRAVCTNVSTGASVPVTNDGSNPLGFQIAVPSVDAISCVVYNRAAVAQSSIAVAKRWTVNGVDYAEGSQPVGLTASLQLNATPQDWDVARNNLTAGSTVAISETNGFDGRELCRVDSARIVEANGATVNLAVPSSVMLAPGANHYTISNVITCEAELTLTKQVEGGPASPTSWDLDAVAPNGALAGPTGVTGTPGATAKVTPNVRYPLVESGNPLYTQTIRPGGNPVAPSTGSWQCVQVDANGTEILGFNDGINGGVSVPLGYRVRCTALNRSASLTLIKQVLNDNGGTKSPADWTLTATPQGTVPAGVVAQNVTGSTTGSTIAVRPGTTYQLSESGPTGYAQKSLQCNTGVNGTYVDVTSVQLASLDRVTCIFVNDDQPAKLTLVKQVDNGSTGASAVPADWTLTATGPKTITGATGATAITGATVSAGTYALSESGPAGYTGSAWSCTGGTLTGSSLALANGQDVTCTITNTATVPKLTLVKQVDNGSTGASAIPTDWTLTATGPTTITGATGASSVTSAAVQVGTYTLSESTTPGYQASAWVCTGAVSSTATTVTVALGSQATCTITNTAVAPKLTLAKEVTNNDGGTLGTDDFTLTAASAGLTVSGASGDPAITGATVPVGSYTLSESSPAPLGYALDSLVCLNGTDPITLDPTTPVLTLTLGMNVSCTFTNGDLPAKLTLVKEVDAQQTGSTVQPADWTLTATPQSITGQSTVTGPGGGAQSVANVTVKAGVYALSETGPSGFDSGSWVCQGGVVTNGKVTVPNGGNVICTITNTARTPHLTLVKEVSQGAAASVESATAWTLTAAGPTPISGTTGAAAVTTAAVKVGVYALGENAGPTGYTASAWSCTAGTLSGSNLTLAEGQDAVCTITNTAQPAEWTITKTSNPVSGTTVEEGDVIAYTVTIAHTGGVTPTGVTVTDDMSDVLDDAALTGSIVASTGSATVTGTDLVWTVGSFTGTQTVTYSVTVGDHLDAVLRNVVTPPTGATCVGTCETTHSTARWDLSKSADPASGTVVDQGQLITYTLTATNTGPVPVTDAVALDDLSGVLDHATLVTPVDGSLAFDEGTKTLTWTVPALAVGGPPATVSFQVLVNEDAFDVTLNNLATPNSTGGRCTPPQEVGDTPCETSHRVALIDIGLTKSHGTIAEGAVNSGRNEPVDYVLTVTNHGSDPVEGASVSDKLPASLALVEGSITLPGGWTATAAAGTLTLTYTGVLAPGESAELSYRTLVGKVSRATPTGAFDSIKNTACVSVAGDDNSANDCATDLVKVKAVAIGVQAQCVNDTPIVTYDITPMNLTGTPTVSMIWWTEAAFAAHDPAIDAADTAALLADGASKVDNIALPSGWAPGDPITGRVLWPGAAVDATGAPTAWPGWVQRANGDWELDPTAPFYNLRGRTVVEVRINPSTDAVIAYPPATPACSAVPPTDTPTKPIVLTGGGTSKGSPSPALPILPRTGGADTGLVLMAFVLIAMGALLGIRRRKGMPM